MPHWYRPAYRDCVAIFNQGPLYYSFLNCLEDAEPCPVTLPEDPPEVRQARSSACSSSTPAESWYCVPEIDLTFVTGCTWAAGYIGPNTDPDSFSSSILVNEEFVSNLSGSDPAFWPPDTYLWAECGRPGVPHGGFGTFYLDPAHPECICNNDAFHCVGGSWDRIGSGNLCHSYCPVCVDSFVSFFDNPSGWCRDGPNDGSCPPGTHWSFKCKACVSDVPPRKCWAWSDEFCKWLPPGICDYPKIWNPLSCSCICLTRSCGPTDITDHTTCECIHCPTGQCYCATEHRCIDCKDPPCKIARGCTWNVTTCDWDCHAMACPPGQHYDLYRCACITDCPPGKCWCEATSGTGTCVNCTPPACTPELNCQWDSVTCTWVCDAPPCLPGTGGWDGTNCRCSNLNTHNLTMAITNYHAVSDQKGILYEQSDHSIPPFASSVQVTSKPAHKEPAMIMDWRRQVILLYTEVAPGGTSFKVVEQIGDSGGRTWSKPRTVFNNMKHAKPAGPQPYNGCVVYAAYNAGVITAVRRYPGDTADSAPFNFKDDLGVDLAVDDTSFGLRESWDGPCRWLLYLVTGGVRKHFQSWDDCATWIEVP